MLTFGAPVRNVLNLEAIVSAPLCSDPFDYFVASGVVSPELLPQLTRDFPTVDHTGSFPVAGLTYGPAFEQLLDALASNVFSRAVGSRLHMELESRRQLVTVRGRSGPKDGFVHTDSEWKLVTVLLYLNPGWGEQGGRLRLLRSDDLDDVVTEVAPDWGTLIAFRRSDRSFHGHKPFSGERRLVQVNWASDPRYVDREERRHSRSAGFKSLWRSWRT